jgi:hypothetical protein
MIVDVELKHYKRRRVRVAISVVMFTLKEPNTPHPILLAKKIAKTDKKSYNKL